MNKESIFNSPRVLFFVRCSFFNVSKISNEQSSSSSSNDYLFFTFGKFVPRLFKWRPRSRQISEGKRNALHGWLPHKGLIKALMIYIRMKKFLVRLSKVKLLELWSVCGDQVIGSESRSNIRQCIITHNALRLHPSPAKQILAILRLASLAGVFRGARISSLPTTRDEIRPPLKTPAWEAILIRL